MLETPARRSLAGADITGKDYTVNHPTREDAALLDLLDLSEQTRSAAKWVYWQLLANAYKHGNRQRPRPVISNGVITSKVDTSEAITLQLFVTGNEYGRCVRIELKDLTDTAPRYSSGSGWGLAGIRAVTMGRCYHEPTRTGKVVWAEVPIVSDDEIGA